MVWGIFKYSVQMDLASLLLCAVVLNNDDNENSNLSSNFLVSYYFFQAVKLLVHKEIMLFKKMFNSTYVH